VRKGIRDVLKKSEEQRVREAMLPVVEAEERKVAESLAQIHASLRVIEQVKGKLAGRDFGHYGMPCRLDVDRVFDSVLDPGSDLAVTLRQAAALGYVKLPEQLR